MEPFPISNKNGIDPLRALRLPLDFNPHGLRADLARIPSDRWILHFNKAVYKGNWSGVALRGPANVTHPIQSLFATPGTKDWACWAPVTPGRSQSVARKRARVAARVTFGEVNDPRRVRLQTSLREAPSQRALGVPRSIASIRKGLLLMAKLS